MKENLSIVEKLWNDKHRRNNDLRTHTQNPAKTNILEDFHITRRAASSDILNDVISGINDPLFKLLSPVDRLQRINDQNIGGGNIFQEIQNPVDAALRKTKYVQELINNNKWENCEQT